MNDSSELLEIITGSATTDVVDEEEQLRRSKFNCRNLPWKTIKVLESSDEVETWQKYGTPFYIRGTHGGSSALSKCKAICTTIGGPTHQVERKRLVCASVKCNTKTVKCPVQYRILHCYSTNIWWIQELEEWWLGPKGLDQPPIHLNTNPTGVDKTPAMHSAYKSTLEDLYTQDARAPKSLVNLIATQSALQL